MLTLSVSCAPNSVNITKFCNRSWAKSGSYVYGTSTFETRALVLLAESTDDKAHLRVLDRIGKDVNALLGADTRWEIVRHVDSARENIALIKAMPTVVGPLGLNVSSLIPNVSQKSEEMKAPTLTRNAIAVHASINTLMGVNDGDDNDICLELLACTNAVALNWMRGWAFSIHPGRVDLLFSLPLDAKTWCEVCDAPKLKPFLSDVSRCFKAVINGKPSFDLIGDERKVYKLYDDIKRSQDSSSCKVHLLLPLPGPLREGDEGATLFERLYAHHPQDDLSVEEILFFKTMGKTPSDCALFGRKYLESLKRFDCDPRATYRAEIKDSIKRAKSTQEDARQRLHEMSTSERRKRRNIADCRAIVDEMEVTIKDLKLRRALTAVAQIEAGKTHNRLLHLLPKTK
jgi:hypothetical protein